jgi:hypothetical protein
MEANQPSLPLEIEAAVAQHHGGPVSVAGQHGNYVVMDADVYRDQMGFGNEEDLQASVAALKISLTQAAADETISLEEASAKLRDKYGA